MGDNAPDQLGMSLDQGQRAHRAPAGAEDHGRTEIEVGYQAAVYMNAINHYALSQVSVPPAPASVGVFLATAQHLQSTFTNQGPYLTAGWSF